MKSLIDTLRRFDSLETVIAELEAFDDEDVDITTDGLADYLSIKKIIQNPNWLLLK